MLVGGAAKVKGMVEFTKDQLSVAARLGVPAGYSGVSDEVERRGIFGCGWSDVDRLYGHFAAGKTDS